MIPTVTHQLSAIRNTIAKTILPALGPDEQFAREQAGLSLACLDWTIDVHEHEHRYELVEHEQGRRLLSELVALGAPAQFKDAAALLAEAAEAPKDLGRLREQSRRLKALAVDAFQTLADAGGGAGDSARRLMVDASQRQSQRELAWCRLTGFPQWKGGHVSDVLDAQQQVP